MRDAYIWQVMAGGSIGVSPLVGECPTESKVARSMRRNLIKVDEIRVCCDI